MFPYLWHIWEILGNQIIFVFPSLNLCFDACAVLSGFHLLPVGCDVVTGSIHHCIVITLFFIFFYLSIFIVYAPLQRIVMTLFSYFFIHRFFLYTPLYRYNLFFYIFYSSIFVFTPLIVITFFISFIHLFFVFTPLIVITFFISFIHLLLFLHHCTVSS